MRRAPRATVLLAGLLSLAAVGGARAAADDDASDANGASGGNGGLPSGPVPTPNWLTLETPHFELHYYAEERAFAERSAHVAERAYRLITRYLNWRPSGRVSIALFDHTDTANGGATSVPYNHIYAYGVPPDGMDELSDFDDFVKLLITHEFTHVVHLDTILSWCPRLVNTIFGKIYAPNLSQPNWFIEGLAVLMETRQTTAGRLRSSFQDMHLRVPLLEGRLLSFDKVNIVNGPLVYPRGSVPYLYGGSILRYLEDRFGPDKVREISHRYADECIPGGVNRIAIRATGSAYTDLVGEGIWEDWKRTISHRYTLEIEEAGRRGLTLSQRLTNDAPSPRGTLPRPLFFRDGTLVYNRVNNDQAPAYVRLDVATGKRSELADAYGGGPAAPTPDGRGLVFQRASFIPLPFRIDTNAYADWTDIYLRDLEDDGVRPLTHGFRAHEPDVSPDGSQVACAAMLNARPRQLALVSIDGGAPRALAPDLPGIVYTPAFSPDGRLIAYSRVKPGGYRDIHIYDLASGSDRALMFDRAMDVDPRFSPDGRFVLFASDRTGIYDVYAHELATARLYQVTNLATGAFQPVVSPDGKQLVYTGFTSDGFDLFVMSYDPQGWPLAQPFANARPDAPVDVDSVADSPDAARAGPADVPVIQRTLDYRAWKYMYPRSWSFAYYSNGLGMGRAGYVQTTISDPIRRHVVALELFAPLDGEPSARIDYSYLRLWPEFSFNLRRTAVRTGGLIVDGSDTIYKQHILGGSATMRLPVLKTPQSDANLTLSYDYVAYGPADPLPITLPGEGIVRPPERGPDAFVTIGASYTNAKNWGHSISAQTGRSLSLSLRFSETALGGRFSRTEVTWSWQEYLTPPWARLHALALLWAAGTGFGDKRDGFFLGGFPDQDILRTVFLGRPYCCGFLRGYPAFSLRGESQQLFSLEYRLPLIRIEQGYSTFPLYFRQLWGAAFVDSGNAFNGPFRPADLKSDVGGEVTLQFNTAYYVESQLKIGYAHGFSAPGGDQWYVLAAGSF
jgi:Tol biopolymer transport system component